MAIKIQLRRDTAQNWYLANPILKSGEIGIETDTLKFKVGNGSSRWNAITSYALKPGEANGIATLNSSGKIPSSQLPDTVSIGQEVRDAIAQLSVTTTDVAEGSHLYFTTQRAIDANAAIVAAAITSAESYTDSKIATEISARNTAINTAKSELTSALETYADNAKDSAISTANANITTQINALTPTIQTVVNSSIANPIATEVTNRNAAISSAITGEVAARNTAITNAISAIPSSDLSNKTTNDLAEGSTHLYFTDTRARSAVASDIASAIATEVNNRNTAISGSSINLSTKSTDDLAEGTNNKYFTAVRAIAANKSKFDDVLSYIQNIYDQIGFDTAVAISNATVDYALLADRNVANGYAGLDSNGQILNSALPSNAALLDGSTFTGLVTAVDLNVTGNLNIAGTTTTVNSQNLAIEDSLIYLSKDQYTADVVDIGIYGAYGSSGNNAQNHPHTGLVRDSADKKWKLISGASEPSSNKVNFSSVTYDTLKVGGLEVGSVTNIEIGYLSGVTSAIQTQLNTKATVSSPTFTGTVTIPAGAQISGYLTSTAAASTYIAKTENVNSYVDFSLYLSKSDATASYLAKSDASTAYLSRSDATATYLSKTDAGTSYLAKADAISTYAPLSLTTTMSGLITTAQNRADSAYTLATTANNKASGYLNSNTNITTNTISYGTSTTPPSGAVAGDIYIQY